MRKIILTTPEELYQLVEDVLGKVLPGYLPPSDSSSQDQLFNIQEAADYLNLAKQTIYGFTSRGQIPHIKKAKRLLFRKSELDQWLMEGQRHNVDDINSIAKNQ